MGLEIINQLKKEKGLTNEELSQKSGVPLGTLSKITSGITKDPKLETLKSIARVLNCSLDDFDDNSNNNNMNINKDEITLIAKYRQLSPRGKKLINTIIKFELSQE
ncbi:helix-turn-helix domain-containing protein [Clostridium perfringens]